MIQVDVSTEHASHVLSSRGLARVEGNLWIDKSGNYYKLQLKTQYVKDGDSMTYLGFFKCTESEIVEGGVNYE